MSKIKPDYTMFMKKPAPLETRFLSVDESESAGNPLTIPPAEIVNETAEGDGAKAAEPSSPRHASFHAHKIDALHAGPPEDVRIEEYSQYAFLSTTSGGESFVRNRSGRFDDLSVPLVPLVGAVIFLALIASFLS